MKTFIIKPLLLLTILTSGLSHAADITLRFQSRINDHAAQLSDVLHINNDQHHWGKLLLDSHPTPGEMITKDKIIAWMTQRIGPFHSTWQGKTRIQVDNATQTSQTLLIDKATRALVKKLAPHYRRVTVKPLSHPNDSPYTLDELKASVQISFPVSKRVCVWLIHKNKHIPIWFKVLAYANVFVANRNLPNNTPIQNDAFSRQERNIAGLTNAPAITLPKHIWLTSSIKRNAILLSNQLKEPLPITHGQPVKVTVHHHAITVVIDAIALTDGTLGQNVTVQNSRTKQTFVAKTIGIQQAEMTS